MNEVFTNPWKLFSLLGFVSLAVVHAVFRVMYGRWERSTPKEATLEFVTVNGVAFGAAAIEFLILSGLAPLFHFSLI